MTVRHEVSGVEHGSTCPLKCAFAKTAQLGICEIVEGIFFFCWWLSEPLSAIFITAADLVAVLSPPPPVPMGRDSADTNARAPSHAHGNREGGGAAERRTRYVCCVLGCGPMGVPWM